MLSRKRFDRILEILHNASDENISIMPLGCGMSKHGNEKDEFLKDVFLILLFFVLGIIFLPLLFCVFI